MAAVELWVDANVIVYHLTGRPADLAARCRPLFQAADAGEAVLYIHPITVAECVFALEHLGVPRHEIAVQLLALTTSDAVRVDMGDWVQRALVHYRDLNIEFGDAMIGALAATGLRRVATFNQRDLARVPGCCPVYPDHLD